MTGQFDIEDPMNVQMKVTLYGTLEEFISIADELSKSAGEQNIRGDSSFFNFMDVVRNMTEKAKYSIFQLPTDSE